MCIRDRPISIGAIVLSKPIVKLLFERGAFDISATLMTESALSMYSIGLVAYGLRDIINKVFYSLQDTKTPMINGAIACLLYTSPSPRDRTRPRMPSSA